MGILVSLGEQVVLGNRDKGETLTKHVGTTIMTGEGLVTGTLSYAGFYGRYYKNTNVWNLCNDFMHIISRWTFA